MLKAITALAFTLIAFNVFASEDSPWVLESQVSERANNASEFVTLQQKYPEVFGRYKAANVTSANIHIQTWEYVGETVCASDDPRLIFEGIGYGLCESHGDIAHCFQTATPMPYPADPCAD